MVAVGSSLALLGIAVWGLGVALGSPMSVASMGEGGGARTAARVNMIIAIVYLSSLSVGTTLGGVGQLFGVYAAFVIPVALLAVSAALERGVEDGVPSMRLVATARSGAFHAPPLQGVCTKVQDCSQRHLSGQLRPFAIPNAARSDERSAARGFYRIRIDEPKPHTIAPGFMAASTPCATWAIVALLGSRASSTVTT